MTLDKLMAGQSGQITRVPADNSTLLRQCQTLGLTEGSLVQVLHRSRGTGPMQIKCAGTLYSIRPSDAAHITIAASSTLG